MSVLDCDSSLVFESRPASTVEFGANCWDQMVTGPYKVARLVKCIADMDCVVCRKRAGLSDRCPACGFKIAGKRSTIRVVCRCGAIIVSCLYDSHRSVVCGICIPMFTEKMTRYKDDFRR